MAKQPTNVAASVRGRLQNLARARGREFQLVLTEFAIERLLYRLGISDHADRFVLKGAMLFKLWSEEDRRATWDLDLLGHGASQVQAVEAVIRDLCATTVEDGITFDPESIRGEEIRAEAAYVGARVRLTARLDNARIPMQVDVGFGDAVTPAPVRQEYPTLLNHPAPSILTYPREVVVAEKLEAAITLGVTSSRMKDLYDLFVLASGFDFDGERLVTAVRSTFERRGTPLPEGEPIFLSAEFLTAPPRQAQWQAVVRRGRLDAAPHADELGALLSEFATPVLAAGARGDTFAAARQPGGPWSSGNQWRKLHGPRPR